VPPSKPLPSGERLSGLAQPLWQWISGADPRAFVLRRTRPSMKRPFRTPQVPWLPLASAVCCIGLMSNLAVETRLRFLVWLVVGLVVYGFYGRKHSRLAAAD